MNDDDTNLQVAEYLSFPFCVVFIVKLLMMVCLKDV